MTIVSNQQDTEVSSESSRFQRIRQTATNICNKIRQKSKSFTQPFTQHPVIKSIAKNVELKIELDFPKNSPTPIQNTKVEEREQKNHLVLTYARMLSH